MPTIDEIMTLKTRYETILYAKVRQEQQLDLMYRDDSFSVPEVRNPHRVLRLGIGARWVDSPAEQIITSQPQAFFEILKGRKEISLALSELVNNVWIPCMKLDNPNPFKESLKNKLCRGESFIRLAANRAYADLEKEKRKDYRGLPVFFTMLDPMVIYASPSEDDSGWFPNCGVPNNVIVLYPRQPADVIVHYPKWTNPKRKGLNDNKEMVEWLEYWDKNTRHFLADGEEVLTREQQKNPYGLVPFVHKYSGFGRRSPDGDLSSLIVSDLKWNRDLIKEFCIIASDISSRLHLTAHKPINIWSPGELNAEQFQQFQSGAYDLNVASNVPLGTEIPKGFEIAPVSAEEFKHYQDTWALLTQRNPFLLAGFPFGSSGRQQDMTLTSGLRRYDAPFENTQLEFATAFEMALEICKRNPDLMPQGISIADLDAQFRCSIYLKASDPIEEDRLRTLGDREYQLGTASLYRLHTKFYGMSEDEHKKELGRILADKVTFNNPEWAAMVGMAAARESGMEMDLEQMRAQMKSMVSQQGLQKPLPKTGVERVMGETETDMGKEMGTEPGRGARRPPERFTRG